MHGVFADNKALFVFVLLGVDATLGDGCIIWEHLRGFRKVKCLQDYSKTNYINNYSRIIPRIIILNFKTSVYVNSVWCSGDDCAFQIRRSEINLHGKPVFKSPYEFCDQDQ